MDDIAIRVEGLSKRYRIGEREPYKALRDVLSHAASAPFRRLVNPKPTARNPESEYIWALKDVSFEVKRGEVVGIIGRNGAGKSTLLKILSRITAPTEGYVEIHGRVGSLLEVGTGFHPELTGRENIYLNGAILGMKRAEIERKFDEIVAFAEVEQFLDTPVKRYSSGMLVRLAFAVAAHLEPEILLVDEVLAVGDTSFQKKCLQKMNEAGAEGKTVLIVSHNLQLITGLCGGMLWIDRGQIRDAGEPHHVVTRYQRELRGNTEHVGSRITRVSAEKALVKWVEILSDTGQSRNTFENGEHINLIIALDSKLPPASYFEWMLTTETGQLATSGGTFMKANGFRLPTQSGLLHARIGPVRLAQGCYQLTLRVGILPGHILDEWSDIETITISRYTPEPDGPPFDSRRGIVYLPCTYQDGIEFLPNA
ncbi:MAG: ATP-binding cassette domain-containing protein [Chloroflexi bacterium]|nr:ATP-binding cassette domain-containing protein [Chloroflexota bacterium]